MPSFESAGQAPLISVIVTSYNYGRYLEAAIRSAVSQDYPSLEVIVTDNASTDDSWEIIKRFADEPRVRAYRQPVNIGAHANYEYGLSRATGEFIAYLSADDYLLPGHFRRLAELLAKHPEVDLPYTDYLTVLENGEVSRRIPHPGLLDASYVGIRNEFAELLAYGPYHCLGTVMLRRSLLDEVGPFQSELLADDFEFLVRLAKLGKTFGYINTPSIAFREHRASLSGETFVRKGFQVTDYVRIFETHALPEMWRLRGYERAVGRHLDWRINNALRFPEASAVVERLSDRIATIRAALARSSEDRSIRRRRGQPGVSVVIPTTERLALLDQTLESVLAQHVDFEIVVVSDAGIDFGPFLDARSLGDRLRFVHLTKRVGVAAARNIGARLARAEIVCFLDDDDLLGPGQLARLCEAIEQGNMVAYCTARLLVDDYDDGVLLPRRILAQHVPAFLLDDAAAMLEAASSIPLAAVAMRRQCLDEAGGFSTSIPVLEGWELLLRLKRSYGMKAVSGEGPQISQRMMLRGQTLGQNAAQYPGALETVYNLHRIADASMAALRHRHAANILATLRSVTPAELNSVEGATTFARTFSGYALSADEGRAAYGA